MELTAEFTRYLEHVGDGLGRCERKLGLKDYCSALMLPLKRKSIEPLAAAIDPYHVPAMHQSLHHFVADSPWSDQAVLGAVQQWVLPKMVTKPESWTYLIADDSGMPKQGVHSVGVARQYCGQLGKTESCQVAVSLSIATEHASLPIKYRLYLPESWIETRSAADARVCRRTSRSPPSRRSRWRRSAKPSTTDCPATWWPPMRAMATTRTIATASTELGLHYVVGIKPGTTVWAPGTGPLPPKPWSGRGIKPTRLRRDETQSPVSVKALALRLAARPSVGDLARRHPASCARALPRCVFARPIATTGATTAAEQWLLIEWPTGEPEPTKYWLSNLPADHLAQELVADAKTTLAHRTRLPGTQAGIRAGHFEGRNWRGFHHHATLCIAAYGFLVAERLTRGKGTKKNCAFRTSPTLSEGHTRRTAGSSSTTRR